jgi:hypothetical protein
MKKTVDKSSTDKIREGKIQLIMPFPLRGNYETIKKKLELETLSDLRQLSNFDLTSRACMLQSMASNRALPYIRTAFKL